MKKTVKKKLKQVVSVVTEGIAVVAGVGGRRRRRRVLSQKCATAGVNVAQYTRIPVRGLAQMAKAQVRTLNTHFAR